MPGHERRPNEPTPQQDPKAAEEVKHPDSTDKGNSKEPEKKEPEKKEPEEDEKFHRI